MKQQPGEFSTGESTAHERESVARESDFLMCMHGANVTVTAGPRPTCSRVRAHCAVRGGEEVGWPGYGGADPLSRPAHPTTSPVSYLTLVKYSLL